MTLFIIIYDQRPIKLVKRRRKPGFIVAVNAFHGKTMGSLSMLG